MVYFENKTRNHAKGFRIQKHLLPANESCVLVLQNCCATDFRKTVIRFVASQVPRRIPPRKFGVPGRLAPFQSLSRRPLRSMLTRRIHRKTSRRSSQNREGVRQTSAYNKHSSHRLPPPQEPIICEAPSRPLEICTSLIPFPLRERRISAP